MDTAKEKLSTTIEEVKSVAAGAAEAVKQTFSMVGNDKDDTDTTRRTRWSVSTVLHWWFTFGRDIFILFIFVSLLAKLFKG